MTPQIERLIESVKFFCSSDQNQIRPTTVPWGLKKVKAELLKLAQAAEKDWKAPR